MGNQQPVNGTPLPPGIGTDSSSHHHQQQPQQQQQQPQQHAQQQQPQQHPHTHHQQQQQQHSSHIGAQRGVGVGPAYGGAGGGYIPTHPYGQPQQQQQPQQQPQQQHPHQPHSFSSVPQQQPQQQQHPALAHLNVQRSSSDASMTIMDDGGMNPHISSLSSQPLGGANAAGNQVNSAFENWLEDDTVPTVFRWEHGGRQVYITGTFNGWSRQIPMHRSGNDFTYIHNLKRGKHAFKFIVDDEWRFAPDQPTVADIEGRINNFIDVTDFKPYTGDKDFEKEKAAAEYGCPAADELIEGEGELPTDPVLQGGAASSSGKADKDGEVFSHNMPDLDDYTKEPPPLPPHLRHIILNKPPQLQDTAALPVPQHVALNHLYCTAIKDNMMVLGITQRYKTKFVTTVYYSPCSSK